MFLAVLLAVLLIFCVTRVAKAALDKALAENEDYANGNAMSPTLPVASGPTANLHEPLIIKIDSDQENHEQ